MSVYKDLIQVSAEFKTLSSWLTTLGKFRSKTEDAKLINLIDALAPHINDARMSPRGKSIQVALEKFTYLEATQLLRYCTLAIGTKKTRMANPRGATRVDASK